MEPNETEDIEPLRDNLETDVYSKLDVLLKARDKITCHKEVVLPCAYSDNIDLSDILDERPQVKPHKRIQDNTNLVHSVIENIRKLKHTSELEMNFHFEEDKNLEAEINQTTIRLRDQTEKLFKRIKNTQIGFNECLTDDFMARDNKQNLEKHFKLIEETCKLDRGLESVIFCNKDILNRNVKKDLKIKSEDQLKRVSNELAEGVLSRVFDERKKSFKKHEHLLAIKQYNKPTPTSGFIIEEMTTDIIDPYTKQKIIKPVRNNICKHIYDEESVDRMFQGKYFVSCPYIGCTNHHFTKKDLLYDLKTSNNSEQLT